MLFILAQICGIIALILTVLSVQFNKKEKLVMCMILANIVVSIQYFLLLPIKDGALTGAIISIINAIRCFVFYLYKKKNIKPSLIILIFFEIVTLVSGIITWKDKWSIIPVIVTIIYTYGLWQDDIKIMRISSAIVGIGWTIYNIVVMAYIGAIQEFAQTVSSIIALRRSYVKFDNISKKC